MKHISIIGVGLIGGSFALDLKSHFPGVYISGIDQNDAHLKEASNGWCYFSSISC